MLLLHKYCWQVWVDAICGCKSAKGHKYYISYILKKNKYHGKEKRQRDPCQDRVWLLVEYQTMIIIFSSTTRTNLCLSVFFALQTKKKQFPAIVYVQRWMVWCTSDITSLDNQRTKGIRQNVVSIIMLDAVIMEKSVCYNFKPLSYSWWKNGWFATIYLKISRLFLLQTQ